MSEYYAQESPKWLSWTDGTNPMDNWMPNACAIRVPGFVVIYKNQSKSSI